MGQQGRDHSLDDAAPAREPRKPKLRAAWVVPTITQHGSLRHLVRGATGHKGDPGTPIGKRS